MDTARTSTERVYQAVKRSDDRFVTASEIADEIDIGRQSVNYHLGKLVSEDRIERKSSGKYHGYWCDDE